MKWSNALAGSTMVLALALSASPASAFRGGEAARKGEVRRPEVAAVQGISREPAGWRRFQSLHGDWRATWRGEGTSPHLATGPGIPLAGFAPSAAAVDLAVRAFLRSHPSVFRGDLELDLVSARLVGSLWHVRYQPELGGIPVRFRDWEFEVSTTGRLFAFGADAVEPIATPRRAALVVAPVARQAARAGLDFDPATDKVDESTALSYVPVAVAGGTEYRLAHEVRFTTATPRGSWLALVDAGDGTLLWRENKVREVISGNVTGLVHPVLPTDPLTSQPFRNLTVSVGPNNDVTDAAGNYSAPATGTVTVSALLAGPFCNTLRYDAPRASISTSATNPSTVDLAWTTMNSHDAERDAFTSVNVAHDYIKTIDPAFDGLDYPMDCEVNITVDACNAFWDGAGVHFFAAGGGCPNMATMTDVVYHEYGHGVNDFAYREGGSPTGMGNGALHEGLADVNAAFILDHPDIGRGFTGPGTILRSIENTMRWPESGSSDVHITGLIIGGAYWDLRQSIGLATAAHLVHFTKYLTPDAGNDGEAMNEFFLKTLVVDDDDANLTNGTPHIAAIADAFNAHGIGTAYSIHIAHTPVADPPAHGDVQIDATITHDGPIGALDAAGGQVHYSINNGPWHSRPLIATGTPNLFRGTIAAPTGSVVRYYLTALDTYGGIQTEPAGAPARDSYLFITGPVIAHLTRNMETDPGWTIGAPGDNATTGIWLLANPVGTGASTPVQPEEDHTPGSASQCFVTGNGMISGPPGEQDVDGGRTTLTTSVFDATGGGTLYSPIIEYYKWYTNDQGSAPATDLWRVDLSNDGGANWVPVENTLFGRLNWMRVAFRIEDYLPPTANMKMRFIAADEGEGSIVEALIDDFRLLGFTSPVAVDGAPLAAGLDLAPPAPNPFAGRTRFAFSLGVSSNVSLRIHDLAGREVRTLASGRLESGRHSVEWDGRDDSGRATAAGLYFARLTGVDGVRVQRVMRLR